jgi:1-acyl-sn-glycerol-3-phosphate acyltransferase
MLGFLPSVIRGILVSSILLFNIIFWFVPLFPVAIIKLALPVKPIRKICDTFLNFICTTWAIGNGLVLNLVNKIEWDIEGDNDLSMNKWYLVLANHQS